MPKLEITNLPASSKRLDDLVIIAKVSHPIPSRTRTLNPFALMVLSLKARESKSLPDLLTASCVPGLYELNPEKISPFQQRLSWCLIPLTPKLYNKQWHIAYSSCPA